ncbi:hypothetical protein [Bifidobacterium catulorum]|uniref:Uncharacterized protein n=1 Tax=Bifidobacterium catulorum TaxID=1630173 RepID=A0A2U2MRR6_9BIFI|nr:hypothetical protein [Bifidobacterium catulorum]PWG59533.1 hypothetical protein DF200_06955 [Bifidobacterium catulorum]
MVSPRQTAGNAQAAIIAHLEDWTMSASVRRIELYRSYDDAVQLEGNVQHMHILKIPTGPPPATTILASSYRSGIG